VLYAAVLGYWIRELKRSMGIVVTVYEYKVVVGTCVLACWLEAVFQFQPCDQVVNLVGRRVKKVSEPALVSHHATPTHSQAPTPHTVMPISCDGRRRESTHKEPIWVIQLKSEGHSFCEMQQKTAVGKTAIHCIVNDWNTIINV